MERLSQKLNLISEVIENGEHPTLSITYFVPDKRKASGEYVTVTEEIKKSTQFTTRSFYQEPKELVG